MLTFCNRVVLPVCRFDRAVGERWLGRGRRLDHSLKPQTTFFSGVTSSACTVPAIAALWAEFGIPIPVKSVFPFVQRAATLPARYESGISGISCGL